MPSHLTIDNLTLHATCTGLMPISQTCTTLPAVDIIVYLLSLFFDTGRRSQAGGFMLLGTYYSLAGVGNEHLLGSLRTFVQKDYRPLAWDCPSRPTDMGDRKDLSHAYFPPPPLPSNFLIFLSNGKPV
ncbi:hypothetical protein BJY01DRAFT_221912 [Aspergillus pseudoustus]|uniref:Uncharacterized protein n=1 Tax=Aspergillus pseudoustus TaxID=1810923 RepID=A0ABR4J8X5_9EURO